ncbi:discoidin domain-containing protein [Archangium primigenium]|nr:discoidin domain-containing protein [Archangium primigenium]
MEGASGLPLPKDPRLNLVSSRRGRLSALGVCCLASLTAAPVLAAGGFVSATASGHDGNTPAQAIDGVLSTRWSADGKGQWLQADLGRAQSLSGLEIAWYRGDERSSRFTLATSTDGKSFTTVYAGASVKQKAAERYAFPAHTARYVRVTVNGNTQNAWASISELAAILGGSTPPPPAPEPTPEPTPEPSPDADAFGVTQLYPTRAGGEAWVLSEGVLADKRFDPQNPISRNTDGSWKMKSDKVRMSVFTSTGYDSKLIPTYDPDVLASRGYMQAANDWKNVEMTGFVKVNAAKDMSDNFSWYARGGRHTDSLACEGTSYKGSLHFDGRVRWQKEAWHVSYEQTPYKTGTASLKGRWVGFKSVMRNTTAGGKPAVKLELWLNENADKVTWKKVYDYTDSGQMGGDTQRCGGAVNGMPLTWGGPIATFRWDSATDVDFKWLSVREISE